MIKFCYLSARNCCWFLVPIWSKEVDLYLFQRSILVVLKTLITYVYSYINAVFGYITHIHLRGNIFVYSNEYKKRRLLRCVQNFKSDFINIMDHMCISGSKTSLVIRSHIKQFKKVRSIAPKLAKTSWSQKGWCDITTKWQLELVLNTENFYALKRLRNNRAVTLIKQLKYQKWLFLRF